jgi:urease accessory protein
MPPTTMPMNDRKSPSPAMREREGPSPPGWEGEGFTGRPSPASLREAPSPAMRERGSERRIYRLLTWFTPAFPVGAFSFSHALEAAVESGAADRRGALENWIAAVVIHGSGRIDADILRDAYRAAVAGDLPALAQTNRRGLAFRATSEMALETAVQGTAFLDTCRAAWPDPFLDRWASALVDSPVCYAAAVGAATARAGIPVEWALTAYLQAMTANLVSAGLRLGIIGQTDGQRILAALESVIAATATAAADRGPDAFGSATFAVELASMEHETQYTRLFRS